MFAFFWFGRHEERVSTSSRTGTIFVLTLTDSNAVKSVSMFLFGGEYGPNSHKFIGFGDIHGPKPYKFIGFGDIHGPKTYKFIGFGRPKIADCGPLVIGG